MADRQVSTKGRKMGVFCMQSGPGSRTPMAVSPRRSAIGAAAGDPAGYPRHRPRTAQLQLDARHGARRQTMPSRSPTAKEMSTSCAALQPAAQRPRLAGDRELPADAYGEDAPDPLDYEPVVVTKYGPDAQQVAEAARC